MIKNILPFLCSLTFTSSLAQTYSIGNFNYDYYSQASKTVQIVSMIDSSVDEVIIPATVEIEGSTYQVVRVANYVFNSAINLKHLIIEDSDAELRLGYNYEYPGDNDYYGKGLFYSCPLTEVYIGRNLWYFTSDADGYSPFGFSSTLEKATISEKVTKINFNMFAYCRNLREINIGDNVSEICGRAFWNCDALETICLPQNITRMEGGVQGFIFEDCSSLSEVTLPGALTSLKNGFKNCPQIKHIILPQTLEYIDGGLQFCIGITSLDIPESVKELGYSAFYGCSNLTSINIPSSISKIGVKAFYYCENIKEIKYNCNEPIPVAKTAFSDMVYDTATLYVPYGSLNTFKETTPWNLFTEILESDFTSPIKSVIVKLPGGNLHLAEEHAGTTVRLTADEGFEFHSASLDDEDVSHLVGEQGHFTVPEVEKPTVLNVVFKQTDDPETAINTVSLVDEVRVTVHGKRVRITGKSVDTEVQVYDLRGLLIEETTESDFTLDHSGVVILRVGADAFKFAI